MDQNLDDSLTLGSSIGVDFEHSETVEVTHGDIGLDVGGHEEGITMEFENIEEQPTLMDTGSEEIIGHDFMEDQFGLQEYSVADDQITAETTVQSDDMNLHGVTLQDDQQIFSSSSNTFDLQYDLGQDIVTIPSSEELQHSQEILPKVISVQTTPQFRRITSKKDLLVLSKPALQLPKQVAIAPKPPKLVQSKIGLPNTFLGRKQYAIAPKPVTVVSKNPVSVVKKISVPGGNTKQNPLIGQLGKQIVMVPGSSQKYKLVSAGSSVRLVATSESNSQATPQLIPTTMTKNMKPVKVILQGQGSGDSNQQKMVTKFLNTNTGTPTRYVTMQQKTVPITDKSVIMASPTKDGIKYVPKKQQIISIKSPTKIAPAGVAQGATTKKVVISANPSQNITLKTSMPSKTGQITSVTAGQKSQLHQIHVPGKGIQYIRLLTNPSTSQVLPAPVKVSKPITVSSTTKTFIYSKDEIIEMTEKTSHPPPLVVTSSPMKDVTSKPQHKLVRIAPLSKPQVTMPQARSGKSLLVPQSPTPSQRKTLEEVRYPLEDKRELNPNPDSLEHDKPREEEVDSKTSLRALIADAIGEDMMNDESTDNIHYNRSQENLQEKNISEEMDDSEHPLIVIPSYNKNDLNYSHGQQDERRLMSSMMNIDVEAMNMFGSPRSPRELLDSDMISADLLRPRKACNCTKSQCLKLYCDCFANGEFCNRCNCNNCYNNLENEELRQKAIRGCLDRNPNAFRPKIGKGKIGGPDIIRRHNKGCNCKRSGCLKNYCECYEAKIACTAICKCFGCRNVEEGEGGARVVRDVPALVADKQPCTFMTTEVISAVCQCLFAAAVEGQAGPGPARAVLEEFSRCLHDIISAAHHAQAQA